MDIICGWCERKIGEKPGKGKTSCICNRCLDYYFPHHAERIREIAGVSNIESIFVPAKPRRQPRIIPPTKIHRR